MENATADATLKMIVLAIKDHSEHTITATVRK
jgi:hypothetical protein